MGLDDDEDGWNGSECVSNHVYAIDLLVGSTFINEMTAYNEQKVFDLMSLSLPKEDVVESEEQEVIEIVEACLRRSFGFKLAHGLILRVFEESTMRTHWGRCG